MLFLENKGGYRFWMDHQKGQMLRLGKYCLTSHKGWSLYEVSSPLLVSDLQVVEELQRLDQREVHLYHSVSASLPAFEAKKWTRISTHS
jgi:hypothetical protein